MKVQEFKSKKLKGSVTAFLSLVMILIVVFIVECMDAASIQVAKNYRRTDMNRAIESVFAEYQRDLLEEYEIFSIDGTYESGAYTEQNLIDRLIYYGADGMEQRIDKIQLLTDDEAQGFEEQIMRYMEHKYGLDIFESKLSQTEIWQQHHSYEEKYRSEYREHEKNLSNILDANEVSLPPDHNPIDKVGNLKKKSVLDLVMPADRSVSQKLVDVSALVSGREKNQGRGQFQSKGAYFGAASKMMLGEYLLEHFSSAITKEPKGALDYELEYIYAGKASDRENLKEVLKKLLLVRLASNYSYLQSSASKKSEAKAVSLALCSAALLPEAAEVTAQVVLACWAYGESIVDLRSLLKSGHVPLKKDDNSWQLSLSGLMNFEENERISDGKDNQSGWDYNDYLRMLLYLANKTKMKYRALDIIELNLHKIKGATFFRADACVVKVDIESDCTIRNRYHYRFHTYFGYN